MAQKLREAVQYIVPRLREALLRMPQQVQQTVLEVRLRADAPVVLTCMDGAYFLLPDGRTCCLYRTDAMTATRQEVQNTFLSLCGYSVHSVQREICEGFLTLCGGHRAGICGTAVTDDRGAVQSLADVTSINLRVARQIPGAAKALWDALFRQGLCSVIVAGPPVSGKTTVLHDLAVRLSEALYRVSVVDSRRELYPLPLCDVLSGYGKAQGILCALRSLSPQMLICDEVADEEEIRALQNGFAAGAECVVSVHARDETDLPYRKPLQALLRTGQFSHVVLLQASPPCRIRRIFEAKELGA